MGKKIVVKFGGSNLKSGKDYLRVVHIVKTYNIPIVAVVSAHYGITGLIQNAIELLSKDRSVILSLIAGIMHSYQVLIEEIFPPKQHAILHKKIQSRLAELQLVLFDLHFNGGTTGFASDLAMSYGERLSSLFISEMLNTHGFACSEKLPENIGLFTDGNSSFARANIPASESGIRKHLSGEFTVVVPGFYGITASGVVKLLGRGGSDYTAAIIGCCLRAASVDLWKDVEGFMTADPKIVCSPLLIQNLGYNEAAELSCIGARILHPETVSPLKPVGIPLRILDVGKFNGEIKPSTLISGRNGTHPGVIKSIAGSDDFVILQLHGADVGAHPGILAEVTGLLEVVGVNFKSLITSQPGINILLSKADLPRVSEILNAHPLNTVSDIYVEDRISVIVLVGEGIMDQAGILLQVLGAVATPDTSIHTVVMGVSAISAYFIVDRNKCNETIRVIHQTLFKNHQNIKQLSYESKTSF